MIPVTFAHWPIAGGARFLIVDTEVRVVSQEFELSPRALIMLHDKS